MGKEEKWKIADRLYLVHKPEGETSLHLVKRFQCFIGAQKAGHAGTLDPLASGLMIIGTEEGTKKLSQFVGLDKVYLADVLFGESRDTGDREGNVIAEEVYRGDLDEERIASALDQLIGEHTFPAPRYSAVKVEGKPLYWYTRKGIEPPFIPEKKLALRRYQVLDTYSTERGKRFVARLRLEVGSGTYIRTLAEELGKLLGYPAFLKKLYRYTIGSYCDCDALRLPEIEME